MARKKRSADSGYVLFDVVYASGTLTSNRKVPSADLNGLDEQAASRGGLGVHDQLGERSTDRFDLRVTEHPLGRLVERPDVARVVERDDRIEAALHDVAHE